MNTTKKKIDELLSEFNDFEKDEAKDIEEVLHSLYEEPDLYAMSEPPPGYEDQLVAQLNNKLGINEVNKESAKAGFQIPSLNVFDFILRYRFAAWGVMGCMCAIVAISVFKVNEYQRAFISLAEQPAHVLYMGTLANRVENKERVHRWMASITGQYDSSIEEVFSADNFDTGSLSRALKSSNISANQGG